WVAWASLPHVQREDATLRLPPVLLGVLRLSLVPRYLACFPRAWSPRRARGLVEAPSPRQGFWSPGPHAGSVTRSPVALPSSRVPPVQTCPALSPRWCPGHSPKRTQDGCLPGPGNRRLPTTYTFRGSLTRPAGSLHLASYGPLRGGTQVRSGPVGET